MNYYKIPEDELRNLILADLALEALAEAETFNWKNYQAALKEYCSYYYANCIEELVEKELYEGYFKTYKLDS